MAAPLIIAATAASAVGALYSGAQQSRAMNQQADAAETNADIANTQAVQARAAGVQNELQQRRQGAQQLSAQRAAVAESGFDPSSGSALLVQQDSAGNLELDALQQRYEGLLRGNAFDSQAELDRYQAKTLRQSAKSARIGSYITAASALLAGGSAASKLSAASGAGTGLNPGSSGLGLRITPTGFWKP